MSARAAAEKKKLLRSARAMRHSPPPPPPPSLSRSPLHPHNTTHPLQGDAGHAALGGGRLLALVLDEGAATWGEGGETWGVRRRRSEGGEARFRLWGVQGRGRRAIPPILGHAGEASGSPHVHRSGPAADRRPPGRGTRGGSEKTDQAAAAAFFCRWGPRPAGARPHQPSAAPVGGSQAAGVVSACSERCACTPRPAADRPLPHRGPPPLAPPPPHRTRPLSLSLFALRLPLQRTGRLDLADLVGLGGVAVPAAVDDALDHGGQGGEKEKGRGRGGGEPIWEWGEGGQAPDL